jgi:hypothetical protein
LEKSTLLSSNLGRGALPRALDDGFFIGRTPCLNQ